MSTEASIINALEALVEESSYDEASVKDICQRANVSTRTFYRYFTCKQDVLAAAFNRDLLQPIDDIHRLLDVNAIDSGANILYEKTLATLYRKRSFYRKVFTRSHPDLLNIYVDMVAEVNRESLDPHGLARPEAEFAAFIIAAANAQATARWMDEGCKTPIDEQSKLCVRWIYAHLRELEISAIKL